MTYVRYNWVILHRTEGHEPDRSVVRSWSCGSLSTLEWPHVRCNCNIGPEKVQSFRVQLFGRHRNKMEHLKCRRVVWFFFHPYSGIIKYLNHISFQFYLFLHLFCCGCVGTASVHAALPHKNASLRLCCKTRTKKDVPRHYSNVVTAKPHVQK
jgi:hypothetical protein